MDEKTTRRIGHRAGITKGEVAGYRFGRLRRHRLHAVGVMMTLLFLRAWMATWEAGGGHEQHVVFAADVERREGSP